MYEKLDRPIKLIAPCICLLERLGITKWYKIVLELAVLPI